MVLFPALSAYRWRAARDRLGEDRILYIHCTSDPLGSGRIYCPFIDTWADYILRGEAGRQGLELEPFLRWTISARNISNSIGYWCYYGSTGKPGYVNQVPTSEEIQVALKTGARIWRTGMVELPGGARFDREYYGALRAREEGRIHPQESNRP